MESSAKTFLHRVRLALLCTVGLLLAAALEPHLLRFAVKRWAISSAARQQVRLSIGSVEGSIFEPLVFRNVACHSARNGVVSSTHIRRAEARFSFRSLLLHGGAGFFDRLALDELESEVAIRPEAARGGGSAQAAASPAKKPKKRSARWLPSPTRLEIRNGSLAFSAGGGSLSAAGVQCIISGVEPGKIHIRELTVRQGAFHKEFTRLGGSTARQGARLILADLQLAPGIWLKTLSTDSADASGRVRFDFAAFGGAIRGDFVNASRANRPLYEVNGSFFQIAVPALAEFLGITEKTGGVLKEGKFTFSGSPHAWEKAAVTLRLEADDFLWGRRQWNTLVLGARIVNRRVEIPELHLRQSHNLLTLKGELSLPAGEKSWWEADFRFDLSARIDNLTELSALFGPRFSDTAGKVTVDGSIASENHSFSGQLIVTGSGLRYRKAPIEILNAGIKLDGNEFQILNLELANGADFVRGRGVVNILGEKRYRAEVNASIAELDTYRPLLEKPIAPAPLAGGVVIDWSGDGTLEAHSGAFTARFRKLRTPGSDEVPATLPIDAELEGTYAPGGLFLSRCKLAHEETRLETRLTADEKTLKFEDLKLTRKNELWLEGSATLPVNLWQWWQAPGLHALAPEAPFHVQLAAKAVRLEEVAHLTGRPLPVRGTVSGPLTIEGTLRNVQLGGTLSIARGSFPGNTWLPPLDEVEGEAVLEGKIARFSKFSARHSAGVFTGAGAVDFSRFENPAFQGELRSASARFEAGAQWSGEAAVDLTVAGTRGAATVSGTARLLSLKNAPVPDFAPLVSGRGGEALSMEPPTFSLPASLAGWRFELSVNTPTPVKLPGKGELEAALRFDTPAGASQALPARGEITYRNLPLKAEFAAGTVESATFQWFEAGSPPRLSARVAARAAGVPFIGYYIGPAESPAFTFVSETPVEEETLRLLLSQGFAPLPPEAGEFNPKLAPPFDKPLPPAPAAQDAATAESPAAQPPEAPAAAEAVPSP